MRIDQCKMGVLVKCLNTQEIGHIVGLEVNKTSGEVWPLVRFARTEQNAGNREYPVPHKILDTIDHQESYKYEEVS